MITEALYSLSKKELIGLVIAMAEQISALPARQPDTVAERKFRDAIEKARAGSF